MMRELFESVLSGYPIGSLLFWDQRELTVQTMANIGPLLAPAIKKKSQISLVLDGHQRLATLYGVLRLPETFPKDEATSAEKLAWWLGYNLELEQTCQLRRPEDFRNPAILPLRAILKTADFVRFARSIDASKEYNSATKVKYLDRADTVQRALRDYRIALTIMRDGDVDDAVAIFSRINRSGRRMSADQMAVALTYHDGFNLEDALDGILDKLGPFGFGDVSRTVILQSLLQVAEQNFTKPRFDDLRKKETQERIKAAVEPVTEALCSTARFLNEIIGFRTGRLLPYSLQLLLLTVFFDNHPRDLDNLRASTKALLSKWFWGTSFSGWFASANSAEIESAVAVMKRFASSRGGTAEHETFDSFFNDRPLRPFPKTFDRRSARIRAMLLVQIARGQLLDPITNSPIDGSALLADPDRRDLPYVFQSDGTDEARSPGNRILLDRKYGGAVRRVLEQNLFNRAALRTHSINSAARAAIDNRSLSAFVNAREAELQRHEANFLAQFGLHIEESVQRSEEEVDVDDA